MYGFLQEELPASSAQADQNARWIQAMEAKYQISIPQSLKAYYLQHNGQKIHVCVFHAGTSEYEVSKIIPIGGDGLTFEKIIDNDREDGFIDQNFYPLASNRGGDIYYWDINSEKIYLIYADDIEHPVYICQSISGFFELLSKSIRET